MSPPPADSPAGQTGPPDRQTLRLLERQLASDTLISETGFEPNPHDPRSLRGVFDAGQYPASVSAARLDIRWFTTGDFLVHYLETWTDETNWECCWDQHPNTHNTRIHFHEPPTGTEITDLELPSIHPLESTRQL